MFWIRTRPVAGAAVGLAFALLAAACGSSTPSGGGGQSSTSQPPTSSGGVTPPSPPPASGTAAVTVSQINYQFTPSTVTVNKGDTIAVKDATTGTPHTFTVTGQNIDVTNDAGQTQTVVIDLPPGTYPFICRFHASLGMKGTLVVK